VGDTNHEQMSDSSPRPLTPEERGRLRRSVDAAALERLLERLPKGHRPLTLLHFYELPTAAEVLDALRAAGADEAELAAVRPFAEYAPLPPHLAHPENDPDPRWVPAVWPVALSIDPPADPEVRAMWEAAEPPRDAA
jgi:hypothetical protein